MSDEATRLDEIRAVRLGTTPEAAQLAIDHLLARLDAETARADRAEANAERCYALAQHEKDLRCRHNQHEDAAKARAEAAERDRAAIAHALYPNEPDRVLVETASLADMLAEIEGLTTGVSRAETAALKVAAECETAERECDEARAQLAALVEAATWCRMNQKAHANTPHDTSIYTTWAAIDALDTALSSLAPTAAARDAALIAKGLKDACEDQPFCVLRAGHVGGCTAIDSPTAPAPAGDVEAWREWAYRLVHTTTDYVKASTLGTLTIDRYILSRVGPPPVDRVLLRCVAQAAWYRSINDGRLFVRDDGAPDVGHGPPPLDSIIDAVLAGRGVR